jgi:hypothetical protein
MLRLDSKACGCAKEVSPTRAHAAGSIRKEEEHGGSSASRAILHASDEQGRFRRGEEISARRLHLSGSLRDIRPAYLAALGRLHAIVERVDVKKLFVDGDDACLLYDLVTKTPAGTSFVAEWLRLRGNRIASTRAVFDARPFAAMFTGTVTRPTT